MIQGVAMDNIPMLKAAKADTSKGKLLDEETECNDTKGEDSKEEKALSITTEQDTDKVKQSMDEGEKNVTQADRWEEMFNRLLVFREKNGHCHVPTNYSEDRKLGKWVAVQRQQRKAVCNSNNLRWSEREARLTEIGFEWIAQNPRCVSWEARFKQLLEFVVQNGHSHVPIGWEENVQLSNWVSAQRQDFQGMQAGRGLVRLNQERINLLNSVGFVWKARRGGLKRLREGSQVPKPRSYEAVKVSSAVYQTRARNLLQMMNEIDSQSEKNTSTQESVSENLEVNTDVDKQNIFASRDAICNQSPITGEFDSATLPLLTRLVNERATPWNQAIGRHVAMQALANENERSIQQAENISRLFFNSPISNTSSQLQANPLQINPVDIPYQPAVPLPLMNLIPLTHQGLTPGAFHQIPRLRSDLAATNLFRNGGHLQPPNMAQVASLIMNQQSLAAQIQKRQKIQK